jgi:hypothetical protein
MSSLANTTNAQNPVFERRRFSYTVHIPERRKRRDGFVCYGRLEKRDSGSISKKTYEKKKHLPTRFSPWRSRKRKRLLIARCKRLLSYKVRAAIEEKELTAYTKNEIMRLIDGL